MISGHCTKGPGATYDLVGEHRWDNAATPCTTPFTQLNAGLLDVYQDRIRFSLMTFDTLPDASTGLLSGAPDPVGGIEGMWSYFLGFEPGPGYPARGNPPACAAADMEVGAQEPVRAALGRAAHPVPDLHGGHHRDPQREREHPERAHRGAPVRRDAARRDAVRTRATTS